MNTEMLSGYLTSDNFAFVIFLDYVSQVDQNRKTSFHDNLLVEVVRKIGVAEETEDAIINSFIKLIENYDCLDSVPFTDCIVKRLEINAIIIYYSLPLNLYDIPVKNNNYSKVCLLMEKKYLDYMAIIYTQYNPSAYLAFIWPQGMSCQIEYDSICKVIKQYVDIVYEKTIDDITFNMLGVIMTQVYKGLPWVGTINNQFKGAFGKASECYAKGFPVHVYLVTAKKADDVVLMKTKIRGLLGKERSTMHSTDTNEEAKILAEQIFNTNTLHMIRYGAPFKYRQLYTNLLSYKKLIGDYDEQEFIIDSSTVMGLYGLRITRDIDYLCIDDKVKIEDGLISNHYKHAKYYNLTRQEMIYNPDNYLVFLGIKFISLDVLRRFKMNRNEISKDQEDVILIDSVLKNKFSLAYCRVKFALWYREQKYLTKRLIKKIIRY